MKEDLKFVLNNFIYFILCGLFCALVIYLISLDVKAYGYVPEKGLVEGAQEILVGISSFIFLCFAWRNKSGGLWLVGGFLLCMFIRELDVVFDKIFHGAWFYVALPVALVCIFKAWKFGVANTIHSLAEFMRSSAYSKLSCGLLIVLVYSRLIGYRPLWQFIMKKKYLSTVKVVVEEGTELFGYSIIFLAAVEYAYYLLKQKDVEN